MPFLFLPFIAVVEYQREVDTNHWFDSLEKQWQDRQDYYQSQGDT